MLTWHMCGATLSWGPRNELSLAPVCAQSERNGGHGLGQIRGVLGWLDEKRDLERSRESARVNLTPDKRVLVQPYTNRQLEYTHGVVVHVP